MQSRSYLATIPQRRRFYPPELHERWHRMWAAWLASGTSDQAVWEEFTDLFKVPGFRFRNWRGGHFAESVVALDLLQQGYGVVRACMLFPYGKALGTSREATEFVQARLTDIQLGRLRAARPVARRLRNPDLAAVNTVGE